MPLRLFVRALKARNGEGPSVLVFANSIYFLFALDFFWFPAGVSVHPLM
jgi:hypothetical protein